MDEFYSYRAERGKTGHFGAVMMLRDDDEGRMTKDGRTLPVVVGLSSFVSRRQEDHVETHELRSASRPSRSGSPRPRGAPGAIPLR